ncbi:glycosyltransferase family 4 protein [Luedemannella flava]
MIVDTLVHGDSRVQKTAYSAAEAGWDVTLLGRAPNEQPQTFELGRARVELLAVSNALARRTRGYRRRLTRPLAYPQTGIVTLRQQQMWAWRAQRDERVVRLDLAVAAGTARAVGARRLAQRAELLLIRMAHRWVAIRSRQLRATRAANDAGQDLRDRARLWFWRAVGGAGYWRRVDPHLWAYEIAFAQRIDELRPDIIHANDFRMLGVGARAALRARAKGRPVKLVWDAHEYLPGIRPWRSYIGWMEANCAQEREYAPVADAVVTVSDDLADLLRQRHGLRARPAVVHNTPEMRRISIADDTPTPNLRAVCGVGTDTPLLVYSGVAASHRGMDLMVDGLPALPDVHVAFVVPRPDQPYVRQLVDRAAELGVADRLHVVPMVSPWHVVEFLSSADVGVSPIHRWPNYEIALSTKFYEYSQARLPIVSSDVRVAAATIRATGQGEVFRAEDLADYVRAVRAVVSDLARYRAAYDKPGLLAGWTWEAQAEVLEQVYSRLWPAPTSSYAQAARRSAAPSPAVARSAD